MAMEEKKTRISRRAFLRTSVALCLMTGIESFVPAYARSHTNMAVPRRTPSGTTTYDLTIGELGLNIGGRKTTATAINSTVPGPLLRFREGEDAVLRITNALDEATGEKFYNSIQAITSLQGSRKIKGGHTR